MAAATALTVSSAARQLSHSASTIFTREVTASHKLTIDGYSASRKLPQSPRMCWASSQPFEAAGYIWRIRYFPNGKEGVNDDYFPSDGKEEGGDDDYISLYLELADGDGHGDYRDHHQHNHHHVPVDIKFSLLDLAGNPVPGYSRSREQCVFSQIYPAATASIGFDDFVKCNDLQESGALKDDCFTIMCDVTTIRDWSEPNSDGGGAPVSSSIVVPPSDLHQQLSDLLWKQKHGADVTIDVAGEMFDAHGWLLAARSPVLEAELQALTVTGSKKDKELQALMVTSGKKEKEKEKEVAARRVMKIKGMQPKVFKAMLHYMYTDTLPQELVLEQDSDDDNDTLLQEPWLDRDDDDDTLLQQQELDGHDHDSVDMARALLAAAHRYKLERLELMCEEALRRRIDVHTVAAILVAAEEHQCQALKAACVEFMARPGCMKAILKTRGFEEMKATCLPILVELLVKQLA